MFFLYFPEVCVTLSGEGLGWYKAFSRVVILTLVLNTLVLYKDLWGVEAGVQ